MHKVVWGSIFAVSIALMSILVAAIFTGNDSVAIYIYKYLLNFMSGEVALILVMVLPVVAIISGIQFLRHFLKWRKERREINA